MKRILQIALVVLLFGGCTNDDDFIKGKRQLEQMGYTEVTNTGYAAFCCSDSDTFSTGFSCKDKAGNTVKGCICSAVFKGVTVRFQ